MDIFTSAKVKLQNEQTLLVEKAGELQSGGYPVLSLTSFNEQNPAEQPSSRLGTALTSMFLGTGVGVAVGAGMLAFGGPDTSVKDVTEAIGRWGLRGTGFGVVHGLLTDLETPVHARQLEKYKDYLKYIQQSEPAPTGMQEPARGTPSGPYLHAPVRQSPTVARGGR
jgi:hypothetical protein